MGERTEEKKEKGADFLALHRLILLICQAPIRMLASQGSQLTPQLLPSPRTLPHLCFLLHFALPMSSLVSSVPAGTHVRSPGHRSS